MSNISFYYYPANVKITKPLGKITLEQFIEANRNPKESVQELFKKIQVADEKEKQELKQKLYYFTPNIQTDGNGRSYSNITAFNGICVVEFDKIPEFASELRDWIFDNFEECFCSYISPSGKGVKTLWKIPVVKSVDEFKAYFYGIAQRFSKIEGFDGSAQNPILPLYLSWDKGLKHRPYEEAKTWTIRGGKINEFKPFEGSIEEIIEGGTEQELDRIFRAIDQTFDKIEREQTAHKMIVNLALWCGGLVATGYVEYDNILSQIYRKIENSNYCQKNIIGYKKTTITMLNLGLTTPCKLD